MGFIDYMLIALSVFLAASAATELHTRPIYETLAIQREINTKIVEAIQGLAKHDEAVNEWIFQNDSIDGGVRTPNLKKESD